MSRETATGMGYHAKNDSSLAKSRTVQTEESVKS